MALQKSFGVKKKNLLKVKIIIKTTQKIKCILKIIVYVLKELIEHSLWDKNYKRDLEIEFILLRDALSSLIEEAVL